MIQFEDMLTDLKAQAEALVRYANDYDGLLTCALRPSNVFGPGDTDIVPFLVNQARSWWTKVCIAFPHLICLWIFLVKWCLSWKADLVISFMDICFNIHSWLTC